MRPLAILVLLTAAAAAQDPFAEILKRFQKAAARMTEPDAKEVIDPAIEALVATGDVRAVKPLLTLLATTLETERGLYKTNQDLCQRGAEARERVTALSREIDFLRLKEGAGDTSVAPEIQKRIDERERKAHMSEQTHAESERVTRAVAFVRGLRDKLANGCVQVLRKLEGDQQAVGLDDAHEVLDAAQREQGLYLVRVLRESRSKRAAPHLLAVFVHPKADEAVLRAAQYALAPLMTRRSAEALLAIWERDPNGRGKPVRHVLSMAAGRKLADLSSARAWIETLDG